VRSSSSPSENSLEHFRVLSLRGNVQPQMSSCPRRICSSCWESWKAKCRWESSEGTNARDLDGKEGNRVCPCARVPAQAREDVIRLLRSERGGPEELASRYGRAVPTNALRSLRRDDCVFARRRPADDVYEKPMAERLEDKQRETYRRMLEQLLLAEKCHRRTVAELDGEKSKHADFMAKSDDFTNLLEQERDRLKKLLEQEEARRARKDNEHSRRLGKLQAQLAQLKSLALMLAEERRLNAERLDLRSRKVRELAGKLRDKERRLAEVGAVAERDGRRALRLEAELERGAATSKLEREGLAAKLSQQESQSRRLREELSALAEQMEELRRSDARPRRSDKDPRDPRDEISEGRRGDSRPAAEPETLRKTPSEMEGEDEKITRAETRCRELAARLRREENGGRELRRQLDELRRRTDNLEKPQGAFGSGRAECSQLRAELEEEKRSAGRADGELEKLRRRLRELESREAELERTEIVLKEELAKLKSLAVTLADDRRNAAERLKAEGEKREELSRKLKAQEGEVTRVSEKLIDESKKLLRLKSETEVQATRAGEENRDLKGQLQREREQRRQLDADLRRMKAALEEARETRETQAGQIKELALERETLRSRLARLEVVEGDLMKTEDRYEALERKFRTEEQRANSLTETVEEMTRRTRQRAKAEEDKSRDREVHVRALEEKIQQLLAKEDQLSLLQADYSRLQRRFREEEGRAESLGQEVADLGRELQAGRRCSRASRPALRIRVTPDPSDCTATVEIAGPRARDFFSGAAVVPTLGLGQPRITIVPRAAAVTCGAADPVRSPVTITTVSRAASPDKSDGRPGPLSIVTVSTRPAAPPQLVPPSPLGPQKPADAAAGPVFGGNVVTAEDKKIHIRLTAADERDKDGGRQASGGKMSSSLTITPVATAATCRSATSVARAWRQL
uniref:Filamin A interacting protein 1 n=1 Tax=Hippocampus comes TaxID=109280 RepID=A0A3Q3DVH2_HIPCM